ncbi:MAG: CoA transferase [Deltaproteobacteria bacterium]|nr:CoA transferase [Deltaproteobacteria bacterium]
MAGALEGIRIVDCTAMITGPFATQILGDQGAEVIKIEPPGFGDIMRLLGTARGGMSTFFALFNRSKRSIVVNLREERGQQLARDLAATADVFIQNFRPGVIDRLGLGEAELRAEHPELVYASISAYGPTGPDAGKPAFDHILQGRTGFAYAQADPQEEDAKPEYVRQAICDKVTALNVSQAITAALFARERTGQGQHLQLSMLDAALSFVWPDSMTNQVILDDDFERKPAISATYRTTDFPDGYLSIAAVTDDQFRGVCNAMGFPELADDPRFKTLVDRSRNMIELLDTLRAHSSDIPAAEAMARLEAEDVPCGPVHKPDDVPNDPQIVASGSFEEVDHPVLGRIRQPRPPARFEATPSSAERPAPALGQDTDAILAELGLPEAERAELRAKGIVA